MDPQHLSDLIFRQDLEGPPQTSKTSHERSLALCDNGFQQSLVGWWLDGGELNYGRKAPFLPKSRKMPQKLRPAYDPTPPGMEFF